MVHEIVHTLGFVAECARGDIRRGRTTMRSGLMWAGDGRWDWSSVDDDSFAYFAQGNANCPLDLAASAFLETLAEPVQLPPV